MKLRDLLDQDRLLLVACDDCHAKTPLDPAPFALRYGVDLRVAALTHDLRCPSCGSADIALRAFSPIEKREVAVPHRQDAGAEAVRSST
jgi:hypothetical protein